MIFFFNFYDSIFSSYMRQGQDALIFVCILYNPAFLLSSYSYPLSPTVLYSCWHCTIQLLEQEQCQSGLILLAHYVQYAAISSLRDICVLCQLPLSHSHFRGCPSQQWQMAVWSLMPISTQSAISCHLQSFSKTTSGLNLSDTVMETRIIKAALVKI